MLAVGRAKVWGRFYYRAWIKSEDDSVMTGVSGEFGRALSGAMELERQVLEAPGMDGLVLRYGFFYGPGSGYANDGHYAREVRKRRFPKDPSGDASRERAYAGVRISGRSDARSSRLCADRADAELVDEGSRHR